MSLQPLQVSLDSLLRAIAKSGYAGRQELATVMPARGVAVGHGELMIIGRAINGKGTRFRTNDIDSVDGRKQVIQKADWSRNSDCPMRSLDGAGEYNPNKSAFWRVVRSVTEHFVAGCRGNWGSHLIWSNLYKVSPYAGGNPSTRLRRSQHDACIAYLEQEMRLWHPKRILFITDWENWARPFIEHLRGISTSAPPEHISWFGTVQCDPGTPATPAVVSVRPERRKCGEPAIVNSIVTAFETLAAIGAPNAHTHQRVTPKTQN